jgi:putative ABC transport system permease protein
MAIPLKYNLRSLVVRRVSTAMTVVGIAAVVAVFIGMMAMSRGLEAAFVATGEPRNIVVLRHGSQVETVSSVVRETLSTLRYLDGVAADAGGRPLVSAEIIIVVNLARRVQGERSNVLIRGISPQGAVLRPRVTLVAGRPFAPGLRQLNVSRALAQRFRGLGLGERVKLGQGEWTVVGLFDAAGTAFDSEVWADVNEIAEEFDRPEYSSVLLQATDVGAQSALIRRISDDQRLHLKALPEKAYWADQTRPALRIKSLGLFLVLVMSIGACFAAMNTMYAAVSHRARETVILQVLGFGRRSILVSFLIESLIVSLAGGILGCLLALPIHGVSTGTANFRMLTETAFTFRITPDLVSQGLAFALLMGAAGGALPARLAARQGIAQALRGG